MNMKHGGAGGKALRDSELAEECVGVKNTKAVLYTVVTTDQVVWHREEPFVVEEDTEEMGTSFTTINNHYIKDEDK